MIIFAIEDCLEGLEIESFFFDFKPQNISEEAEKSLD